MKTETFVSYIDTVSFERATSAAYIRLKVGDLIRVLGRESVQHTTSWASFMKAHMLVRIDSKLLGMRKTHFSNLNLTSANFRR